MRSAFFDTNVFLYAAGKEHPLRRPCVDVLNKTARGELTAVTNAEVLQEILYVYWKRNQTEAGSSIFSDAKKLVQQIFPVDLDTVNEAHALLNKYPGIALRDAVHAATVLVNDIPLLITADTHFKLIKEIKVKLIS